MKQFVLGCGILLGLVQATAGQDTSSSSARRWNVRSRPADTAQPAVQVVHVEWHRPAGVAETLEGKWSLVALNGQQVADNSNIIVPAPQPHKDSLPLVSDTARQLVARGESLDTVYVITTLRQPPTTRITPLQGRRYHIPEKPVISFFGANQTFTGFTGCNRMAGRYRFVPPNQISFQQAAPSTRMVCIGEYNEGVFMKALHAVATFALAAQNRLTMYSVNGQPLLEFERIE